jgi:hypothetical protein
VSPLNTWLSASLLLRYLWGSGFRAAAAQRSTQAWRSARLASAMLRIPATVSCKFSPPHVLKNARGSARRAHFLCIGKNMNSIEIIGFIFTSIFYILLCAFPILKYWGINLMILINQNRLIDFTYGITEMLAMLLSYIFSIWGFIKNKKEKVSLCFLLIILSQTISMTLFCIVYKFNFEIRIFLIPLISTMVFSVLTIVKLLKNRNRTSPSGCSVR